ncbi:hypothetical protein FAM09_10115 [Niastella caeni]|uniref:Uncharacterized protein n=1 Tax=Niastella caeni TaxID=2569763 RepID=A0A4S8HX26_9BACT|nr:hypothetical protein [Niastella caeni]THU40217.1 hypothetical protein FAM09_10115 [Niastella caeni]
MNGESAIIRLNDPEYFKVLQVLNRTITLLADLNTSTNVTQIRQRLSEIINRQIDENTTIFAGVPAKIIKTIN